MSATALDIRMPVAADAVALALLMRVTFREAFGQAWGDGSVLRDYLDTSFAIDKIRAGLAKPRNAWWLASRAGMPVGYAKLKLRSAHADVGHPEAVQLQKIYVLGEFAGRGIGGELLAAAQRWLQARQSGPLWLAVWDQNDGARRFYERHGFHRAGVEQFDFQGKAFCYDVMVHGAGAAA